MSDIATKKVYENDKVIVWEMQLEPGESTGLHSHENTYFFHVLDGSTIDTLDKDGASLGTFPLEAGSTHYFSSDGDELIYGDLRLPATHEAKNIGAARYSEILVELK